MAFNHLSIDRTMRGFAAKAHAEVKRWQWLKRTLNNPLAFVILVWAAMLAMTLLFLTLLR